MEIFIRLGYFVLFFLYRENTRIIYIEYIVTERVIFGTKRKISRTSLTFIYES